MIGAGVRVMPLNGPDPGRIAEIFVTRNDGESSRRGSGYRLGDEFVLTADHVLDAATAVTVRFNADRPDEWTADAEVEWSDRRTDLAILKIPVRLGPRVTPIRWGRVRDADAVVSFSAVGFPRFKLREDQRDHRGMIYRDRHHAVGTIAVLSNSREGTLELTVAPPERDPNPAHSPWEGMSGAAVWSAGRIIGVVAKHHRSDGLTRLAAVRIDRVYERLMPERLRMLRLLTGLPATRGELADVIPPTQATLIRAGYAAYVRDIAPASLEGREVELAELVRFCAADGQYQWWRAPPWAGKTALASWFVLNPPAGVQVTSFFVTGRLAGQSDSDAYTEAMIEQLAAIADEPVSVMATPGARDRERRRLLEQAAGRCAERGERLVLVIDGIDEDEGAAPGVGMASIAALLPPRPPDNVRVIVMSRPSPGVLRDVSSSHPLKTCDKRKLTDAKVAKDLGNEARLELFYRLHGDKVHREVIAFITASGGGLTLRELSELTEQPVYELDSRIGAVFGRSLRARAARASADHDRVYLFAHDTLREAAAEAFGHSLEQYLARIHAWADDYCARGWPESTPQYLLRPYGRLLAARGDLERLTRLATDTKRHDRLREQGSADETAIQEIVAAQQLLLSDPGSHLTTAVVLALQRDRLTRRYDLLPDAVPGLWARLGAINRARSLAGSIGEPRQRSRAAEGIVQALVEEGHPLDAIKVAQSINDPSGRGRSLVTAAKAMAGRTADKAADVLADAVRAARAVTAPVPKALLLADAACALEPIDQSQAAQALADAEEIIRVEVADSRLRDQALIPTNDALCVISERYAEAGDVNNATRIALGIRYPPARARAVQSVINMLVTRSRYDEAQKIINRLEPENQPVAYKAAAEAAARSHDIALAQELLVHVETPGLRVDALIALARSELAYAPRLLGEAEDLVRNFRGNRQLIALAALADAWVTIDHEQAERILNEMDRSLTSGSDPDAQEGARLAFVRVLLSAGHTRRALDVAQSMAEWPSPDRMPPGVRARAPRDTALTMVTQRLVADGDPEYGEHVARGLADPVGRMQALVTVAETLAHTDNARASTLAREIEALAAAASEAGPAHSLMVRLVEALAAIGDLDRAETIATGFLESTGRDKLLLLLADRWAAVGNHVRSADAANRINALDDRSLACTLAAKTISVGNAAVAARFFAQAEETARGITGWVRALRLCDVAVGLAECGNIDAALRIAGELSDTPEWAGPVLIAAGTRLGPQDPARATEVLRAAEHAVRDGWRGDTVDGWLRIAAAFASFDPNAAVRLVTEAREIATGISHPSVQARGLGQVAAALVEIGDLDGAVLLARRVGHEFRAELDCSTALALATSGHLSRALEVARAITVAGSKAQALASIAIAVSPHDRPLARHLTEEAERLVMDTGLAVDSGAPSPVADRAAERTAWKMIVQAHVAIEDWDGAERATENDTTDDRVAAGALLDALTAAILSPGGATPALQSRACRAVLRASLETDWTRALPLIGTLQLEALISYQEVLQSWTAGAGV